MKKVEPDVVFEIRRRLKMAEDALDREPNMPPPGRFTLDGALSNARIAVHLLEEIIEVARPCGHYAGSKICLGCVS